MADKGVTKAITETKTTTVTTSDGEEHESFSSDGVESGAELRDSDPGGNVCDYRTSRARAMKIAWDGARRLEEAGEVLGPGDMGALIRGAWQRVRSEQDEAACSLIASVSHRRRVEQVVSDIELGE